MEEPAPELTALADGGDPHNNARQHMPSIIITEDPRRAWDRFAVGLVLLGEWEVPDSFIWRLRNSLLVIARKLTPPLHPDPRKTRDPRHAWERFAVGMIWLDDDRKYYGPLKSGQSMRQLGQSRIMEAAAKKKAEAELAAAEKQALDECAAAANKAAAERAAAAFFASLAAAKEAAAHPAGAACQGRRHRRARRRRRGRTGVVLEEAEDDDDVPVTVDDDDDDVEVDDLA